MANSKLLKTILRLHLWLQTMRSDWGYCGPISHWWESCLLYCGPMIDWRYEGIICGYLNLFHVTQDSHWLEHAIVAGEDICRAQLPSGQYLNSSFQVGPIEGGTPHEAAVDVALLELARTLRLLRDERWQRYFEVAERNLFAFHVNKLWNGAAFKDQSWNQTVVANKNATIIEAFLLYEELSGKTMQSYIRGAANLILEAQVVKSVAATGGVVHLGTGGHQLAIGIYTARCAAALARLYTYDQDPQYLDSTQKMVNFLVKLVTDEGTSFGYYPDQTLIQCPTWVSPSGDILRAMLALRPYVDVPQKSIAHLVNLLVTQQTQAGSLPTAHGLAAKGTRDRPPTLPGFRDVLPVVGWCDKVFRALTLLIEHYPLMAQANVMENETSQIDCTWQGRLHIFQENGREIRLINARSHKTNYLWIKGQTYPQIFLP